ncbi:hypothetical protein [Oerskovia sp. USHLN155]|uniref:hypothetical protein n=1 Tax=Oerskovia sp. USHLN155 TaxID=3081288 RepID=UPI00301697A3
MAVEPKDAFALLPPSLAADLTDAFSEVLRNFSEQRWEPSELNGGKLCEAAYTIIRGLLDGGNYPSRASKPRNMVQACERLADEFPQAPRSPRIQLPRMLVALYEIRNNRGVGHAGGDVNPNHMDATAVLYISKWIMAELVRILHGLPVTEATEIVESLVERDVALVWSRARTRRVLVLGLPRREQTLLLLVGTGMATESELAGWLEVVHIAAFRRDVLRAMHRQRHVEYSEVDRTVRLLPPGVEAAEGLVKRLQDQAASE